MRAAKLAEHFLHGEEIGQCLARMIVVREAIDDGADGVLCERFHRLMAKRPQHQSIDVLADNAGAVSHALSGPKTDFGSGQEHAGPP